MKSIPKPALIVGAIVIATAILALATYFIFSRTTTTKSAAPAQTPPVATAPTQPATQPATPPASDSQIPGMPVSQTNGNLPEEGFVAMAARITLRLALAAANEQTAYARSLLSP